MEQTLRYSALRLLPNNPRALHSYLTTGEKLLSKADTDGAAIRFGSAVDCLLTTDEFWTKYTILEHKEPAPMMYKFIRAFIETNDELLAYSSSGYKTSLKTVLANFEDEKVQAYYRALKEEKEIISQSTYDEVMNAANKIDKSPWKYLFVSGLRQLNIVFPILGITCSGTLDVLDINHKDKTIRGWDLKTSADISTFEHSYYKFEYFLQATWYNLAIRDYMKCQHPELKDYKLLPFRFLVVDRFHSYPLVYEASDRYKGLDIIKEKLRLWKWHLKTNIFHPKTHYENNYVIKLS